MPPRKDGCSPEGLVHLALTTLEGKGTIEQVHKLLEDAGDTMTRRCVSACLTQLVIQRKVMLVLNRHIATYYLRPARKLPSKVSRSR